MINIEINNCVFKVHPIYDLYACDKDGNVINLTKKNPNKGNKSNSGYMKCSIRKYGGRQKIYYVHRFVWEYFNGNILEGKVIDHINNNKTDNRLCNLQLITQQQNCKKSAMPCDYTFATNNHKNRRSIKALNINTEEVLYFYSMYAVQEHLQINAGIVKMVCEGTNNCKTGISKKNNQRYKFEYIDKNNVPDNCIKS